MEGNHQDKGKSHADANSYELSSRSTSPPSTTPPVALSSSHQDNNLNQQSSIRFRFSSFSAYLGRVASSNPFSTYLRQIPSPNPFSAYPSQFKQWTIDIEKGDPHRDKGKSRADPPVPASPQQGTSSLQHKDKGKSRATDFSVSQTISSSDTPYETSSLVIRSTSPPPVTPGRPIASSSSRRLEDIPSQNTQPPVEASSDYESPLLNRIGIQLTIRTTRWRVINTYFLLVAGTAKSISAYKNASAPANSLDLVIGVVWALISYWFSIFENENPNMIPWLLNPTQLDTLKTVAPIVVPCSVFLCFSLTFNGGFYFVSLVALILERFGFRRDLAITNIWKLLAVFLTMLLTLAVLFGAVYAGFRFRSILCHKLAILYPKLFSIIKLVYHCGDWEITIDGSSLKSMSSLLMISMVFVIMGMIIVSSDIIPPDWGEDVSLFSSVALILSVFPTYLVVGFSRMGIRLAKWLYNRHKAQIKDILSSLSSISSKIIPTSNQTQGDSGVS